MESFLQYHGSVFWVGNIQDGGGDPWHNLLFSKGLTDDQRNTSPLSPVFSSSTTWAAAADSSKLYNFWKQGGRPRKRGEGGAVRRWTGGRADRWMDDTAACWPLLHPGFRVRPSSYLEAKMGKKAAEDSAKTRTTRVSFEFYMVCRWL